MQVFSGFYLLARSMLRRLSSALLAFVFFFLNGGLGMIYFTGEYSLKQLLTGFYKTPTNLGDKGIRWVNVIADMLLPQGLPSSDGRYCLLYCSFCTAPYSAEEKSCFFPRVSSADCFR